MFIKIIDGYTDITKYDEIRIEKNERDTYDVTGIKFLDSLFANTLLTDLTEEEAEDLKMMIEINLIMDGRYIEREAD